MAQNTGQLFEMVALLKLGHEALSIWSVLMQVIVTKQNQNAKKINENTIPTKYEKR